MVALVREGMLCDRQVKERMSLLPQVRIWCGLISCRGRETAGRHRLSA